MQTDSGAAETRTEQFHCDLTRFALFCLLSMGDGREERRRFSNNTAEVETPEKMNTFKSCPPISWGVRDQPQAPAPAAQQIDRGFLGYAVKFFLWGNHPRGCGR